MNPRPLPLFGLGLALSAVFGLAACSPDAPTPPVATAPATTASPAATPTAAPAAAAATATPAQARTPGPIVPPTGPAPVAGTDYVEIPNGTPFQPGTGKIEVVEVFGYVCPACAAFQPLVSEWEAKLPADVHFTYVPAPFGPEWIPYAKGFYVAQDEGLVEQTHEALISAIHVQQTMPGEGDGPDEAAIAKFYGGYGADPDAFLAKMRSFATNAKVNRGKQFMLRSGVASTPTLVVNGKYRVTGKSFGDMVRIAEHLVAMERAAMAAESAAAPAAPAPAPPTDGAGAG